MRGSSPVAALAGRTDHGAVATQRLVLDVEVGSDPIAGRLRQDAGGSERRFSGWMELVAGLEALNHDGEDAGDEDER